MKSRIAEELKVIADEMVPNLVILTINRDDSVEKWAYNEIHFEIQRFLDRIRQNEELKTVISREDTPDAMAIKVGFSPHEAKGAIVRSLTEKAHRVCCKYGVKRLNIEAEDGLLEDIGAALELKKVASLLEQP